MFATHAFFAGCIHVEYKYECCLVVRNFSGQFPLRHTAGTKSFRLTVIIDSILFLLFPPLPLSFYSPDCVQNFLIFLKIYKIKLYTDHFVQNIVRQNWLYYYVGNR